MTNCKVSTHEAAERELSLHMRDSNITTEFIPAGLKKQRTRILKQLQTLDKMGPKDTNIYAPNIIDRYKNGPDNLGDMC